MLLRNGFWLLLLVATKQKTVDPKLSKVEALTFIFKLDWFIGTTGLLSFFVLYQQLMFFPAVYTHLL